MMDKIQKTENGCCYGKIAGLEKPVSRMIFGTAIRSMMEGKNADELLGDVTGILVPGGFGSRGIDGKITAIKYAREHKIPFLGLCLGMQLSIVEYARNVAGLDGAHSIELDPNTQYPVIALMPDQNGVEDIGGTLRLGSFPCVLDKTSKAYELYGEELIHERHRHRYEVNNNLLPQIEKAGLKVTGLSADRKLVEIIEVPNHPWFVACQFHPEFTSTPRDGHPLFEGFVKAARENQLKTEK